MNYVLRTLLPAAVLLIATTVTCKADGRVALAGRVVDAEGRPVAHAMVTIWHAGVKRGYSTFCPSCYADCGKHTSTDEVGRYSLTDLHSDLWFELLVVRDGYVPAFLDRIDPAVGPPATAVVRLRSGSDDPTHNVRGHVVDSLGNPLREAIIEPQGVADKSGAAQYGVIDGLDPLAVTNEQGTFEIHYARPADRVLVSVEARTMAPRFVILSFGKPRQTVALTEGVTIRGRLVEDGRPLEGAEVGLFGQERFAFGDNLAITGSPYKEMRVGTQDDGTFAFTNVPMRERWYLYAKMESVLGRGATEPEKWTTEEGIRMLDVGDLTLKSGHRLKGKVILSDGRPVASGMRVLISSKQASDTQTTILSDTGEFEFTDLPSGNYSLVPAVKNYALPDGGWHLDVAITKDVDDVVVALNPAGDPAQNH